MGLFKEVESIIPPKKHNKTIKLKTLKVYDAIMAKQTKVIRTLNVKSPVVNEKPNQK